MMLSLRVYIAKSIIKHFKQNKIHQSIKKIFGQTLKKLELWYFFFACPYTLSRYSLVWNLLKLGDAFGKVLNHEFGVLQHNIGDESVLGHLYLQLLLCLSQPITHKQHLITYV